MSELVFELQRFASLGSSSYGTSGNDPIYNDSSNATIDGMAGNDTITNYHADYVSINGGADNDLISLSSGNSSWGWKATVKGGTGNDTIYSNSLMGSGYGAIYQYAEGDGYDVIVNYNANDTISISGSAKYTRETVGSNVVLGFVGGAITLSGASGKTVNVSGGSLVNSLSNVVNNTVANTVINGTSGNDTISNSGQYVTINASSGNDSIYNSSSNVTINGGDGYDTIENYYVNYVSINAGASNDSISNYSAWYSTVNAGDGNDTIIVPYRAHYDSINGGAGADVISLGATALDTYNDNNTILGGAGNDTIYGNPNSAGGNVYRYDTGDGYDSIVNFKATDTISLPDSAYYTRSTVGTSVVISLLSGGAMTLAGATSLSSINFNGGIETVISSKSNYTKNTVFSGSADKDTLNNYAGGVTIRAGAGDDSIYNSTSSYYTINNSYGYVTIDAGDGADTIYSNDPYVSISGGYGNDSINNRWTSDVTIDAGSGNDTIITRGGTVKGSYGNDVISLESSGYNKVIQFASGDGYDTVHNFDENSVVSLPSTAHYRRSTIGSSVVISLTSGSMTLLEASDKNISIIGGICDSIISNTLSSVPVNGTEGNDIIDNSGSSVTINAGAGNDSVSNNQGNDVSISGGEGDDTLANSNWNRVSMDGGNGNDVLSNSANYVTMRGGAGNDSIVVKNSYAYITTLDGGEDNDTLTAYGGSISGGAGNDLVSLGSYVADSSGDYKGGTINGGTGNDTFFNGSDNPLLYQYALGDGNDSIVNFKANDTLSIGNGTGTYSKQTVGSDIIVTVGDGKITLTGAASLSSINIDGVENSVIVNYNTNSLVGGTSNRDTIENHAGGVTIRGNGGDDSIYSSVYQNYTINSDWGFVTIDGGDGNDTIYSGNSNVSINGGAGNDSIYNDLSRNITVNGGSGNDTIESYGGTISGGTGNDFISLRGSNVIQFVVGDGYDTIYNYTSDSKISLQSSAYYTRSTIGSNVVISLISGGAMTLDGAASISSVSITGGIETVISDKDSIDNYTKNTLVSGTNGNSTLKNYAGGVTIRGNGGNDSIYNSTSSSYTINNSYGYVTIDGGDGADTIYSNDPYVSISGGYGNDSIYNNWNRNVTVLGGAGADTIISGGGTVNGGTDNDIISLNGGNVIQFASGDGNDTVYNYTDSSTVSLMSNAHYRRSNVGSNIVISLTSGSITLLDMSNKTVNIPYGINDDDTVSNGKYINNSNDNSLLSGTSYADTIYNYGDRDTINAGDGNDTIYNNKGDNVSINASDGNDSIYGNNDYATVNAGAGQDTISGNHWRSKLSGDGDNDLISITTYSYNTIDGGDGDDTLIAGGNEHSVNGGAGADKISLSGNKLTVRGGTGDDTIYGDTATSHLYQYAAGDGNDIIYNWSSNDTLTVTGGDWSSVASGENVLVNVVSGGTISLMGAKGKNIKINPDPAPIITQQEVIKKFMKSLDTTNLSGTKALDQAVSVATGGYFTKINDAVDSMVADCRRVNNADNFLQNYCGIILGNDDTGAITGSDAGGSTYQKTASGIIPESGNSDSATLSSFTTNGLTVYLSNFDRYGNNIYAINYNTLTDETEKYIWRAFEKWWTSGALNLITESYGSNYSFGASSSTANTLSFGFYKKNGSEMAVTRGWFADYAGKTIDTIAMGVNISKYGSLIIGNSDGMISGRNDFRLDRVLAHEFTHAIMYANVNYVGDLPDYIMEGFAELTHGTDDDRKDEITTLAENPDSLSSALKTDCYNSYAGGYMFLRWLAKQGSEHYQMANSSGLSSSSRSISSSSRASASTLNGSLLILDKLFDEEELDLADYSDAVKDVDATALADGILIIGNQNDNSIAAGSGNDTISGNAGADTLNGNTGNDILKGEGGDDVIRGDAGNDTINGGTGNDTLIGGAGSDVFIYKQYGGDDVITDYTPGQDKIWINEEYASVTSVIVDGNDVILTIEDQGTITVKDGAGQRITVVDYNGNETSSVYGSKASSDLTEGITDSTTTLTLDNNNKAAITLPATYIKADASARTTAIGIEGNALANSIIGGTGNDTIWGKAGNDKLYGYKGNDILNGGTGNDTLWGQAGNDTLLGSSGADTLDGGAGNDSLIGGADNDLFIYGAGNDVISDYATGDRISLGAAISKATVSGSDVVFTVGTGTLTVKNGKGKTLSLITSTGKTLSTIISGATKLTLTETDSGKVTLPAGYITANASVRTSAINIDSNELDNSIIGGAGNDTILGRAGNDKLYGYKGNDILNGGAGNDTLWGQAGNDTLLGSSGADTLDGGAGNDSLIGGADNDLFIYGAGNDVISDYAAGDRISLGAAISKATVSGSNVVFTTKNGSLTVKNGKDKTLSLIDSTGKELSTIIGGATKLTLTNSDSSKVTLPAGYVSANASVRTSAISIEGNTLNNTIIGGSGNDYILGGDGNDKIYGYKGNDTLVGGSGNDSLWGQAGADTFIYSDGDDNDIISGFDNTDMLEITGDWTATYDATSKAIAFTVGDGSITLKDFGSTSIFNVNGTAYKISGTNLVRK